MARLNPTTQPTNSRFVNSRFVRVIARSRTGKFPDLRALVQYGDVKGVLIGWYQINCICCDGNL